MSRQISDTKSDNLNSMNILIIGLGVIGAGFGNTEGENHATSSLEAGFKIIGGIDPNLQRCTEFVKKFNAPIYKSIKSASHLTPDVVVIASDASNHIELIESTREYFTQSLIICEKPFGDSYIKSFNLVENLQGQPINLIINYSRQFSPGYSQLQSIMKGDLQSGSVIYNNGLSRSCSHYLRLCIGLFGEPKKTVENFKNRETESNPSFSLEYERGSIIEFVGIRDSIVRIAEFIIITDTHVLTINQGIYWSLFNKFPGDSSQWIRDLNEIGSGTFLGGMANLYTKIIMRNIEQSIKNILDDALPIKIIEEINLYGK